MVFMRERKRTKSAPMGLLGNKGPSAEGGLRHQSGRGWFGGGLGFGTLMEWHRARSSVDHEGL